MSVIWVLRCEEKLAKSQKEKKKKEVKGIKRKNVNFFYPGLSPSGRRCVFTESAQVRAPSHPLSPSSNHLDLSIACVKEECDIYCF